MTKTLHLTFLTSNDKKVTLTVDEPKLDITKEEVRKAMEKIIEKNVFTVENHSFVAPFSAKIIERSVNDLIL